MMPISRLCRQMVRARCVVHSLYALPSLSVSSQIACIAGFTQESLTVDGATLGAIKTYCFSAISANHSIFAVFIAQKFTVTARADPGGFIKPAAEMNFTVNDNNDMIVDTQKGFAPALSMPRNVFIERQKILRARFLNKAPLLCGLALIMRPPSGDDVSFEILPAKGRKQHPHLDFGQSIRSYV